VEKFAHFRIDRGVQTEAVIVELNHSPVNRNVIR